MLRNKNIVFNCNLTGRRKLSVYVEILTRSVNMKLVKIVNQPLVILLEARVLQKNYLTMLYCTYGISLSKLMYYTVLCFLSS